MRQFRENLPTDGRMDDGQTHPIFQEPSGRGWGSKKSPVKNKTACKYERTCSFNYCCSGSMTFTPPTAGEYFGENENRIILSYSINR